MRVRSGTAGGPAPSTTSPIRPPRPGRHAFTAVLGERVGPAADAPPVRAAPAPAAPRPPPSPVRALLQQTLNAEQRVETLLVAAARSKTFSPAELLALQASVFRYSQAVEVVSRATDKLVGAVKQAMGTQV